MSPLKLSIALLALLLLSLSTGACDFFEQPTRVYDDDPQLEFTPLSATVDEKADTVATKTVTTSIQLIGPQRDSALPVNFVAADTSTAVEGVHYSLPNTSATIPAGESATEVTVEILDNEEDDGETNYELFLVLQDSEGAEAAENLKVYTLTIRGEDEDEDEDDGDE